MSSLRCNRGCAKQQSRFTERYVCVTIECSPFGIIDNYDITSNYYADNCQQKNASGDNNIFNAFLHLDMLIK